MFYQSCPLCGLCVVFCHKSDGTKSYGDEERNGVPPEELPSLTFHLSWAGKLMGH